MSKNTVRYASEKVILTSCNLFTLASVHSNAWNHFHALASYEIPAQTGIAKPRKSERSRKLTLRRIDPQRGPVKVLLVVPVDVPHEGPRGHAAEQDSRHGEYSPRDFDPASSAGHVVGGGDGCADSQAGADAREVEDALGDDEAHVEEEIARRQEGEDQEADYGEERRGHEDRTGAEAAAAAGCSAAGDVALLAEL